jgi:hypothetical protein
MSPWRVGKNQGDDGTQEQDGAGGGLNAQELGKRLGQPINEAGRKSRNIGMRTGKHREILKHASRERDREPEGKLNRARQPHSARESLAPPLHGPPAAVARSTGIVSAGRTESEAGGV